MNLLLLKITDTKTGQYVIARYVTKDPNKGWPNVPWLNRHNKKHRLKRQIIHFGVDQVDLHAAWERAMVSHYHDPLNMTNAVPPVIKKRPRTEEHKRKQSEIMKAKPPVPEQRKRNISEAMKRGYRDGTRPVVISYHNAENVEKMNKTIKNNPYNKNRPKVKCEHCYKIVSINMYHRWHGENCKNNW